MNINVGSVWELASHQFVQVTLVALVVGLLVRFSCRRRPHLGYILLMLIVVKCVTPPLWSSPTGVFSWVAEASEKPEPARVVEQPGALPQVDLQPIAPVSEPVPVTAADDLAELLPAAAPVVPVEAEVVSEEPLSAPAAEAGGQAIRFEALLLLVWAIGAVVLAVVVVFRGLLYERMLRRTRVAVDDSLSRRVAELSQRMGVRRGVRVVVTTSSFGPAVCGPWRPRLVLPEEIVSTCPPQDFERILAHELIHIRRGDDLVSVLQIVAQVLWWFHPLVWWTNRQICRERELCCDEETIAGLRCEPHSYAQTLLDLLKQKRQTSPLLAFARNRSVEVTARRLESIMDGRRVFRGRMPRVCWAALIVGLAVVLPGTGHGKAPEVGATETGSKAVAASSGESADAASLPNEPALTAPEDMAIFDERNVATLDFSPDGRSIAVSGADWSTARLYVAPYPPRKLKDYEQVVELENATYGMPAVAWCRSDARQLALIVQQTKSHKLPRIKSRDELQAVIAKAGLTRDDYEFVLYTVNRDGSNLRRVCSLEGGPINGQTRKGNQIDLVWPGEGGIYYYMEGRIVKVDPDSGKADLVYEETEETHVRGLYLDGQNRLVTIESARRKPKPAALLALDRAGRVVERQKLSDLVNWGFLIYGGGKLYVDPHSAGREIQIMQLGDNDPAGTLPDDQDGWTLHPLAITRNERELVCRAFKSAVFKDAADLPEKGEANAEPSLGAFPEKMREEMLKLKPEYEFTYRLEKLVRVPIRLDSRKVERPKVVAVWPPEDGENVDPNTEIRIRFDQPMDPEVSELRWDISREYPAGFQPRGAWRYVEDKNEFVFPVTLTPGVEHRIGLQSRMGSLTTERFRSRDGELARQFSWTFHTRELPVVDGERPKAVSIEPELGSETGLLTFLRIRFDQPVSTEFLHVRDVTPKPARSSFLAEFVSDPFPCRYDSETRTLSLPVLFSRKSAKLQLELAGLRSGDGVQLEPLALKYTTSDKFLSPEDEQRIESAGREPKLRELVEQIRERRRDLKSAEITVRSTSVSFNRGWCRSMRYEQSRFAFQGENQFYADVSNIMQLKRFLVGSDGRECWFCMDDKVTACGWGEIDEKEVVMADPFPLNWYKTVDEAIERKQLEYAGTAQLGGVTCHRIRSWRPQLTPIMENVHVWDLTELWIDAESLLPLAVESYGTGSRQRHDFTYGNLNEAIDEAQFRPPAGEGIVREGLEPLGEGYDHTFLRALDGSSGRMSARWGKMGPGKTYGSGLN